MNMGHELILKLRGNRDDETKASLCRVLLEQAKITDGELPADTQQFSADIMTLALASMA